MDKETRDTVVFGSLLGLVFIAGIIIGAGMIKNTATKCERISGDVHEYLTCLELLQKEGES